MKKKCLNKGDLKKMPSECIGWKQKTHLVKPLALRTQRHNAKFEKDAKWMYWVKTKGTFGKTSYIEKHNANLKKMQSECIGWKQKAHLVKPLALRAQRHNANGLFWLKFFKSHQGVKKKFNENVKGGHLE